MANANLWSYLHVSPNLLVMGLTGIAVGMAAIFLLTIWGETIDAVKLMMDNPE